jgi:hypothetical protein
MTKKNKVTGSEELGIIEFVEATLCIPVLAILLHREVTITIKDR